MDFSEEIAAIYRRCGDRHIVPFIGEAFAKPEASDFRAVAIGFNCYVSPGDWPNPIAGVQPWFASWWDRAGMEEGAGTHRFYNAAFREVAALSQFVASAPRWSALQCDLDPRRKRSLYATNALKFYADEDFKKSSAIAPQILAQFDDVWRDELDTMARFEALPHLVVIFGRALWESHWRGLHPQFTKARSFAVRSYQPAGNSASATYHHANRIVLECGGREHALLLVCLHHPSARARRGRRRDAAWLQGQGDFRRLLDLPPVASGPTSE